MNLSYSEEQIMIRDSIARFIRNEYDFKARQAYAKSRKGFSDTNWATFADLGWLGLPFSKQDFGLGGSIIDLTLIMEEFGKGLVVEPYLANVVLGGMVLSMAANNTQKENLMPSLLSGDIHVAFAYLEPGGIDDLSRIKTNAKRSGENYIIKGMKSFVINGGTANKIIVCVRTEKHADTERPISLFIVDANTTGVEILSHEIEDGSRAADITFNNVTIPAANRLGEESRMAAVVDRVLNIGTLAVCAEAVGAMEVTISKTVEYTQTREQFGQPISEFQALQHRMTNMFIEHQQAKSATLMATLRMEADAATASKPVSAAKARVGNAAQLIGEEAVQLHGGMGIAYEYDIGHFFKRLTLIEQLFGSTDHHVKRFASH